MTLPILYLQPEVESLAPASRVLLHWRAADMSLTPLTQQTPTFTRATFGWAPDQRGQIRKCMYGQTRYVMYDSNADGVYDRTALLLEPSRTNGWTFSDTLTNVAYTAANATIAASSTYAGPDGRQTTFKLTEDSTVTIAHGMTRTPATMTDSTLQAHSCYVRAGTRTWCFVRTISKANVTSNSWVNLSTGASGTTSGNHTIRITPAGNGWYRIACIWNCGTGATTPSFGLYLATADNTQTYTGGGTAHIFTTHWQHEVDKSFETSYINTGASTATRNADQFSLAVNWRVPTDLTVYFRMQRPVFYALSGALGHTPYVFSHGQSTVKYGVYFDPTTRNVVATITDSAGTTQTSTRAMSLWTTEEVEGCVQFQSLQSAPTSRIDLGTGFGTASTAVTGLQAFGTTAAIGDLASALGSNALSGAIGIVKVAAGAVTLADMRTRY